MATNMPSTQVTSKPFRAGQQPEDEKNGAHSKHKLARIYCVDDDVLREIISWAVVAYDQPWPVVTPFPSHQVNVRNRAYVMSRLVRVCRRFKEIVYGHAVLWASIAGVPGSEEGFNFVLERARQVPLSIADREGGHRSLRRILRAQCAFATNHLDRVRILCVDQSKDYNWLSKLSGRSAPALTALDVYFTSVDLDVLKEDTIPPLDAPSLRSLRLSLFFIPFRAPQLQELSLSKCYKLSPATLLDVLSSTPLLERLSLAMTLPFRVVQPGNWPDCTGREVHLSHLERLILHCVPCDTVAQFLSYLVLPAETGVRIELSSRDTFPKMRAMGQALQPFLSCPAYDTIRIREGNFIELFALHSQGLDSPRVSLSGLKCDENPFGYVAELTRFLLPRHITFLDLGLACEARSYDKEAVEKSLLKIAPAVQTLSIEVKERLELSFLTDELSWLKFPALRTLKINWLDKVPNKQRDTGEWDGLRAWMKRVGAKQLETLHLDGWGNSIDNCIRERPPSLSGLRAAQ
ncbi:hypothetical protein PENSPDRAFT_752682 [Peniophora sp. CONT]|nr:hypothetical protein PENSPDRAFT_752682 [Peniophora sp. CONT]